MKKKLLFYFLIFLVAQISFAQKDTVFYKNGKILIGEFGIASSRLSLYVGTDIHKKIFPITLAKFFSKGKYYYPVELTLYGKSNMYIAERVLDGACIDLLMLDLDVENPSNYYKNFTRKFFFVQNGRIILINGSNLDAFYKVYFGKCYDSEENENLENTYNSIISVLNNYNKCSNRSEVIENQKVKIIKGYGIGVDAGFFSNKIYGYLSKKITNGKGSNYGLSSNVKLIGNMAITVELGKEQSSMETKDSIIQYNSVYSVTSRTHIEDITMQRSYLSVTFSKFFQISPKLELSVGVGGLFGKYTKAEGEINFNYQFFNKPVVYEKPKPVFDIDNKKLNPTIGLIAQLHIEYFPIKNLVPRPLNG